MKILGPDASELGFRLDAADIAPVTDPAWSFVSDDVKREYFRRAAHLVRAQYEREREQGLAPDGGKLMRLSERTIANRRSAMTNAVDPNAEPFLPGHQLSRTISFLRTIASKDGLFITWKRDPRLKNRSFGLLLWWHKEGYVPNTPRRDVMFLSKAGKSKVLRGMMPWWLPRARQAAQKAVLDTSTITRDQIKISIPPGAQVVPREQRRADDKWGFGRKREFRKRVAVSGVDVGTPDGGRLGPGTVTRRLVASGPSPAPPGPPRARQGPLPRPLAPLPALRAPLPQPGRLQPLPKPLAALAPKAAVADWIDLVEDIIASLSSNGDARVLIADIRDRFPQIPRGLMDQVLRELLRRGRIVMYEANAPWDFNDPRNKEAVFKTAAGNERHFIYWEPRKR